MSKNIMDSLRTVLPLVKELVQEEICIVLTDKTKYWNNTPMKILSFLWS